MDFKSAKRMELFSQFAVAAAREAMDQSGLDMSREDPYLVGCCVGSESEAFRPWEREHTKLENRGPGRINPLLVPL